MSIEDPDIQALSDHIILELLEDGESRTPSGLLIPATVTKSEQMYQRYRVISVGPECTDDHVSEIPESSLYPGDVVLVAPQQCGVCQLGGRRLYITHYDSIAALVNEPIREIDILTGDQSDLFDDNDDGDDNGPSGEDDDNDPDGRVRIQRRPEQSN